MEHIIEAIHKEQKKLIDKYKDFDIAEYHMLKGYLDDAIERLGQYQRKLKDR